MRTWWWWGPVTTAWWRRCSSPAPGCRWWCSRRRTRRRGGETETPFRKVPGLRTSTGAYLLGLMPPELMQTLGLDLPLLRRDPHYFLPDDRRALPAVRLGPGGDEARSSSPSSPRRTGAPTRRCRPRSAQLREDIAPDLAARSRSRIEETAERYVRARAARGVRRPVPQAGGRSTSTASSFKSDLLKAMYAVTDGFSGLDGDLGHAGHRDELPGPQHVPAARARTAPG